MTAREKRDERARRRRAVAAAAAAAAAAADGGKRARVRFRPTGAGAGAGATTFRAPGAGAPPKPPDSYEGLILYYLAKLKSLFSSGGGGAGGGGQRGAQVTRRGGQLTAGPQMAQPSASAPAAAPSAEDRIRDKVYNVVSAALEYGMANDVLEKQGHYFALRTRGQRIAARAPTPGPQLRRFCSRCSCAAYQNKSIKTPTVPGGAGGAGGAHPPPRRRLSHTHPPCRCRHCAGVAVAPSSAGAAAGTMPAPTPHRQPHRRRSPIV